MTPASPAANSEEAGTGQTWFKIWEALPTFVPSTTSSPGSLDFPYQGECATPGSESARSAAAPDSDQITFRIPPSLPSGQYLIRGEQIALHGELGVQHGEILACS